MRRLLLVSLLLTACGPAGRTTHAGVGEPQGGSEIPAATPPEGRLPADVRPTRYALELAVDPAREGFTGVAEIDVTLPRAQHAVYLHGEGLEVSAAAVTVGGVETTPARWEVVDEDRGLAAVHFEAPVGPGQITLRVTYGAPFDRTLEGLYRVDAAGESYAFTQMEALGARKAFPCFDEPSFKAPFDVTLVVREGHAAIANGPELSAQPASGGSRRVRFATTEPLPTYLVAFAVGPLDVVEGPDLPTSDVRDRAVPFRAIAPAGQGALLAHAIEHTPRIVAALEEYFQIPYPYAKLDIIAVPDFAAGAMENAGAITFRDSLLLLGEDAPISQQLGFAFVMAHELAHQWFGNLVTMDWWDDLWLNEAFATWMETQIIEATFPEFQPQIAEMGVVMRAMDADSLASARQIRQPIVTNHDIHNAFDSITYSKGNGVLAMFEQWLGRDVFRRGVQRYLREHAGGNARGEDLVRALSQESGVDARGPFNSFLDQPGVPLVSVTPRCADGVGSLVVAQSRFVPLGSAASPEAQWALPFCARVRVGSDDHTVCEVLEGPETTVALPDGCASWVMPNAGGLGYYRWTLPEADLEALRTRGLAELTVRETMSFADSLEAAHDAGRASFQTTLQSLQPLTRRAERPLAVAPMGHLRFAIDSVLEEDRARTRARRFAAALYVARARQLGWAAGENEDPDVPRLRERVLSFLAETAEHGPTIEAASRRGRAYLGLGGDGALHPDAVPAELAPLAATVAVRQGGAAAFDHALARLREATDPVARRNLLAALSGVHEPALAARTLELTLDAEVLRVNEVLRVVFTQLRAPQTRDAAWAWFVEHYDPLAARLGPGMAGYLPYAGSSFCTPDRVAEVRAFFTPRVEATQGGPRNLALAVESMEVCVARAAHARETAAAAF